LALLLVGVGGWLFGLGLLERMIVPKLLSQHLHQILMNLIDEYNSFKHVGSFAHVEVVEKVELGFERFQIANF
jgi:hypothetical protein